MSFLTQLLDPALRFERRYVEHLLERFRFLVYANARIPIEAEWLEPRGLRNALASSSRVVLTGAPGAGKTTTLAWLARSNAHVALKDRGARLPLCFAGRDNATLPRVTDLPRGLNLSDLVANDCPPNFFSNLFASRRALVLIDDADRLPSDQLAACEHEYKDAQIIVTAQTALTGFDEFVLPGFRDTDIDLFAKNLNGKTASEFIAALKANSVPRSLTASPMFLGLLAHVWRADRALPLRRADLFDLYANDVLDQPGEAAKMLEGFALAMQRGRPAPNDSPLAVAKSRGFLRITKSRTVEFVHDLWQSYFAARALRLAPDLEPLQDHLTDPAWRETILFYAGLGETSELVDALVARGEIFLAGRALAHAREVRAELSARVTQDLIERAWAGDALAVVALGEMNSPIAVDFVAAKLKEKDPTVRLHAAEILGQLQLDRGIEYLLPQLRDVNGDVRDRVVQALGQSRTDRVIEPLLVALRGDSRVGTVDTRLRAAAAQALGVIGSDKAVPALIVDLQIGEPAVRAVAAEALKRINSSLMLLPLQGVLKSGDEQAQAYAAEVLAVVDGSVR